MPTARTANLITMMAAAGRPWTVIPLSERRTYMAALEQASVEEKSGPFATLLAELGYTYYQPQFLHEFLSQELDPRQSADTYVKSRDMPDAAPEIVSTPRLFICQEWAYSRGSVPISAAAARVIGTTTERSRSGSDAS